VGDGLTEGAGVSSGGPESIDGADVGGVVGTCPRLPDAEHAAFARSSVAKARVGMIDEVRMDCIGWAPERDDRKQSLIRLRRRLIAAA
jgi:hypothetical protein